MTDSMDHQENTTKGASAPQESVEAKAESKVESKSQDKVESKVESKVEAKSAEVAKGAGKTKAATKAEKKAEAQARGGRRAGKIFAGSAVALLAAGVVAAGTLFPADNASKPLTPAAQKLPLGDSMANCVGPTRLLAGAAQGADPEFAPDSSSTTSSLNAAVLSDANGNLPGARVESLATKPETLVELAQTPVTSTADAKASTTTPTPGAWPSLAPINGLAKGKAAVVSDSSVNGQSVLRTEPLGNVQAVSSASVLVTAPDGDLQGLAAASCQTPSNEIWLVGANTTVGRTSILIVTNSSDSSATLSLELFGSKGRIPAPSGSSVVLRPHSTSSIVLAGLAPEQQDLSINVKSSGAAVSAVIQQSVLRGLTSGGVDYLQPSATPSTTAVIPGVKMGDPAATAKITGQSGYSDAASALQVAIPGEQDATLEVKVLGTKGQVALPNGGVFTAKAGSTSELSLAGLPQGNYSLAISSTTPFSASARQLGFTKAGAAVDIAFSPASPRLGTSHLLTVPGKVQSTLVFTSPAGSGTVSLIPVSAKGVLGTSKNMTIAAGGIITVDPQTEFGAGTAAVLVSTSGEAVYGNQVLTSKNSADIAQLGISGTATEGGTVKLTTGY